MVNTAGLMGGPTMALGKATKCMDKGSSLGLMADATKVNTSKTRSMVLVLSSGQTVEST